MLENIAVVALIIVVLLAVQGVTPNPRRTYGTPPTLRSSRQPLKFSLRALLITMTVVALALGTLICAAGRF